MYIIICTDNQFKSISDGRVIWALAWRKSKVTHVDTCLHMECDTSAARVVVFQYFV